MQQNIILHNTSANQEKKTHTFVSKRQRDISVAPRYAKKVTMGARAISTLAQDFPRIETESTSIVRELAVKCKTTVRRRRRVKSRPAWKKKQRRWRVREKTSRKRLRAIPTLIRENRLDG